MADIIEHFNWKYVAAIAHDGSYGQNGVRGLEREAYNRKTFCVAFAEFFTRSDYKGNIETIIAKLKREKDIQVIVFWSDYDLARLFLEQARKQRLFGRTFLLSEAMAAFGPHVLQEYSSVFAGSLAIMPHKYRDLEFENHLTNLSPKDTKLGGNPWWEEYWRGEANCTTSFEEPGILACSEDMKVSESGFQKLFSAYIPYVTDAVYVIAHGLDLLYRCELNTTSSSKCPEARPRINPKDLLRLIKNVTFKGVTGNIHFTDSGNPTSAHYDLMNFRTNKETGEYSITNIGFWKEGAGTKPIVQVIDSSIQWNTDHNRVPTSECSKPCKAGFKQTVTTPCCWECFQCPEGSVNPFPGFPNCTICGKERMSNKDNTRCVALPVLNIKWEDPTAAVMLFLTGTCFSLNLFVLAVFIKHHDTPIVKGDNRELSYLLLFLISLSLLMPILHLVHPAEWLCYLVQPWRYLTCTACVSVLFLKTNRLVRVFQAGVIPPCFKKYILDRKRQLAVVFFLNLIQMILASLWLALDPPYIHKDIKFQRSMFTQCKPYRSGIGLVISAIMFGYFTLMSLLCTLYAFKARRLPENFNEAKYIGFSMYVLLLSWIAYYPVDSALEGSYITIVACSTALMISYGLLGCMYFPKVFIILRHPEENTQESVKAEVQQFSISLNSITKHAQRKVSPSNS